MEDDSMTITPVIMIINNRNLHILPQTCDKVIELLELTLWFFTEVQTELDMVRVLYVGHSLQR
jgi:hypothetical protein